MYPVCFPNRVPFPRPSQVGTKGFRIEAKSFKTNASLSNVSVSLHRLYSLYDILLLHIRTVGILSGLCRMYNCYLLVSYYLSIVLRHCRTFTSVIALRRVLVGTLSCTAAILTLIAKQFRIRRMSAISYDYSQSVFCVVLRSNSHVQHL